MRFFNFKSSKKANVPEETNNVSGTDAEVRHTPSPPPGQTSKPSSEKESILVDELVRGSTFNEDSDKELVNPSPAPTPEPVLHDNKDSAPNEKATKEEAPKEDSTKEVTTEDKDETETPDEEEYPTTWRLVLITIGLCFCVFCVALVLPPV
jgi:hypothetical protein